MTITLQEAMCAKCDKRKARNGGLCWECLNAAMSRCNTKRSGWGKHRDGRTPIDEDGTGPLYDAALRSMEDSE